MSLILEALKKSEAERRLGQAPGLMTPMSTHRAPRRVAPMWVAAGLIAVLAAGGTWWMRDRFAQQAPTTSVEAPTANAPPMPTTVAPIAETISEEPAVEPARPPERARSPDLAPAQPVAPTPAAPEFASVERESIPVPAIAQESKTTPSFPAPEPAAATAETPAIQPIEPARATAEPVPLEAPSDLPRLDQLPASERDALPPLKLSMHVYAESPIDRFVLVDGRRYREGEKLAASLQVVEIRREGVVLDFNGRQFLLLRP